MKGGERKRIQSNQGRGGGCVTGSFWGDKLNSVGRCRIKN